MKIHNFSAGPGILPHDVLRKAAESVIDFNNSGLSLLEISHRSADFEQVMQQARSLAKELLELGDDYEALFLQGGASLQFHMAPLNLLKNKAAYINTGNWASEAIAEARKVGEVNVIASSEDRKFTYIPTKYTIPIDADYLHITSNNTIFGTQWKEFPQAEIPLVCDMSSDIFSRKIPANQFSLIYAGAQKNMGPAGTTLVVFKKDILGKTGRNLPKMLDYELQYKKDSMFNTPPVFAVYASMLTMQWIKDNGGIEWIEALNKIKAKTFYNEVDSNPMFEGTVEKPFRSYMNGTFVLKNTAVEQEFERMLKEAGISGLKGHRSVGGYRCSMYNALPLESIKVLTNVMREFANKFA
ncbi:MAG: 3-phosphoserine/phosphohydroxythreonine transaminase [Candidatus Competibacteraceae bacterium]|nr:3-phosphoserine/phosphohydroxythreonine transaminase [Candidatus Competibacteraceae bacterium]